MRPWLSPLVLCVWLFACGGDKSAAPEAATGPIVGVLEFPISLRSKGAAPSDFHDVEISPTEVHVGGQPVLTLTSGTVPAADRKGDQVPKLAAALGSTPHAALSLAVASAVPYDTVALVLGAAHASGVKSVAFKVRAPGSSSDSGFLSLEGLSVRRRSKTDEEVPFDGLAKRPWDDFAAKWEEVQNACRASPTGNCAFKPAQVAQGGDLKIVLYAAGQGVNVNFFRIGGPPPEPAAAPSEEPAKSGKAGKAKKKRKVELLDGVKKPKDIALELEAAPPATEAMFQFRAQEAVSSTSAVSESLKPICSATPCGVVVQAEKNTLFVRVASLLGAAFPDGATTPKVVFELPP